MKSQMKKQAQKKIKMFKLFKRKPKVEENGLRNQVIELAVAVAELQNKQKHDYFKIFESIPEDSLMNLVVGHLLAIEIKEEFVEDKNQMVMIPKVKVFVAHKKGKENAES